MSVIGYFGVVVPDLSYWQGFYLDDEVPMRQVNDLITAAEMNCHRNPNLKTTGILQGTLAQLVTDMEYGKAAVVAMALAKVEKINFFVVKAKLENGGVYTDFIRLTATSVNAARSEIENLPEVIKAKIMITASLFPRPKN